MKSFNERVYSVISGVPEGKVTTYKHVATALGTTAYRAVGQALKRNPRAPIVPCHRVIASDRTIGGFRGMRAGPKIRKKISMLEAEGVRFKGKRVVVEDVFIPPKV